MPELRASNPDDADRAPVTPVAAAAWRSPWHRTLKARVAAGALAALLVGMALTSWHMARVAEANLLAGEQEREHDDAQRTAAVIGRRVAELQRALRVVGDQMERSALDDRTRLAAFLQDRPVLRSQFASVSVIGPDGGLRLLFDGNGTQTPKVNVADRDYFRRAIETQVAVISAPIASRVSREPLIVFAQPLSDGAGVWGVLAGALRLASRDLIEDLAETRGADDERLVVVTDDHGRILAHPQSAHILEVLQTEPRLAGVAAQWLAEGRPLLRNAGTWTSEADVVAMAGEPVSGWHVWSARSRATLLAPLHKARDGAVVVAMLFAVAMSALLLAFLVWQLRPLSRLEQRAAALSSGDDDRPWPQASGEVGSLSATLQRVWAQRRQAERLNAEVLQQLSSVMAASPIGLAFSRHQRFALVSAECCRLLGRSEADLLGQPMATIFPDASDYTTLRQRAREAFLDGGAYEGEWELVAADGHRFWARIRARPVVLSDPSAGSIWSLYDISDQVEARSALEHAARHDPLTGVLNRKGFDQAVGAVYREQPRQRPASVVVLDLDRFKPINDQGGHAAGDAMLRAVAQAIVAQVRGTDCVARLGGDEFAVLLAHCDEERAVTVAHKIRQGIADLVLHWDGRTFRVGASLGVAELAVAHETPAAWLEAADAASYEAKRAGRDAVRIAALPPPIRLVQGR